MTEVNRNDPNLWQDQPPRQPWDLKRKRMVASVLFFIGTMLAIIFRFGIGRW